MLRAVVFSGEFVKEREIEAIKAVSKQKRLRKNFTAVFRPRYRSATGPSSRNRRRLLRASSGSRKKPRLNARRFVSEHDVGRFAAGWTIEVMHGVVPLPDRAVFRQAVLPVVRHAAAQISARRRFPKGLDLVDITDTQPLVPLQGIPVARQFLFPLQEIAHADASLPQQGLAGRKRGPRQHVHSVEVADAVDALALQRPRQNVRPIEVADTHAAVTLQCRPRQDVRPIEVADAHAAIPLQRSGQDVCPVEVTDTHAALALQRRLRQDLHTVELVGAGSTFALQQSRRLAEGPEGPQRVTVALLLIVLQPHALRVHQRLQIERALGSPGRLLAGRQQRRARAHEHAVLAQPGSRPGRDAAHLVHRMLHAVDVELRVAPVLRTRGKSRRILTLCLSPRDLETRFTTASSRRYIELYLKRQSDRCATRRKTEIFVSILLLKI